MLVIAASNELHFWDWSQPQPFRCVKTNNISSKIRYISHSICNKLRYYLNIIDISWNDCNLFVFRFVAFDSLGHKLITGISCWSQNTASSNNVLELLPYLPSDNPSIPSNAVTSAREQLPPSYHNLIQRYDNLVRNYHRIIMSRSHSSITVCISKNQHGLSRYFSKFKNHKFY